MKKLFTIIILITCLTSIKAQYVTIPDANFVNWLQTNLPSAMNGNQMDTTSLSVTTRISVSIQNKSINNLSGIQYFDSLRMLDCGNIPYNANANTLINMPRLPNKLKTLACYNNQLSSLPTLPPTLDTLLCYTNFITSLPNLPNQLTYLNCGSNALDSLPFLPNSIKYLYCSGPMNVYYLPSLPNSLITLSSRQLLLNSLPNLPNTLINLDCSLNPLDSLPPLPNSLKTLSIGYCHIPISQFFVTSNDIGCIIQRCFNGVMHILLPIVCKRFTIFPIQRIGCRTVINKFCLCSNFCT